MKRKRSRDFPERVVPLCDRSSSLSGVRHWARACTCTCRWSVSLVVRTLASPTTQLLSNSPPRKNATLSTTQKNATLSTTQLNTHRKRDSPLSLGSHLVRSFVTRLSLSLGSHLVRRFVTRGPAPSPRTGSSPAPLRAPPRSL